MKVVKLGMLALAGIAAACSGQAPTGNAALGITEFQVTETATALTIVGLDAQRTTVGELNLTLGAFVDDDYLPQEGRTFTVNVQGKSATHKSAGYPQLELPLVKSGYGDGINAFLQDPNVAPVLGKWGITFKAPQSVPSAPSGERAYSGGVCTYNFSASCGAPSSCCEGPQEGESGNEYVCCPNSVTIVDRLCTGIPIKFGGSAPNTNSCGSVGPQGCAVCWSSPYTTSCDAFWSDPICDRIWS